MHVTQSETRSHNWAWVMRKEVTGKEFIFTFSMEFSFNFDLSPFLFPTSNLDHFPFCFILPLLEIFHFQVSYLALDRLPLQKNPGPYEESEFRVNGRAVCLGLQAV